MSKDPVSGRNQQDDSTRPDSRPKGKRARYETMVAELYQDVYRYAFWLSRNQGVAEDLVQETFLRAWRSFDSLKNEGAAKAWLFTILRRENARLYERYRPDLVDIEDVPLPEEQEQEPYQRQKRAELHAAMMQLDADYRDPLLLQVIGGFSGKEIAGILDLNNNTVMTRLFRARSKLRDILAPEQTSSPDEDTGSTPDAAARHADAQPQEQPQEIKGRDVKDRDVKENQPTTHSNAKNSTAKNKNAKKDGPDIDISKMTTSPVTDS